MENIDTETIAFLLRVIGAGLAGLVVIVIGWRICSYVLNGDCKDEKTRRASKIFSVCLSLTSSWTAYLLGKELGIVYAVSFFCLLLFFSYIVYQCLPEWVDYIVITICAIGGISLTLLAGGGYFAMQASEKDNPKLAEINTDIVKEEKELKEAKEIFYLQMSKGQFGNAATTKRDDIADSKAKLKTLKSKKDEIIAKFGKYEYGPLAIVRVLSTFFSVAAETVAVSLILLITVVTAAMECFAASVAVGRIRFPFRWSFFGMMFSVLAGAVRAVSIGIARCVVAIFSGIRNWRNHSPTPSKGGKEESLGKHQPGVESQGSSQSADELIAEFEQQEGLRRVEATNGDEIWLPGMPADKYPIMDNCYTEETAYRQQATGSADTAKILPFHSQKGQFGSVSGVDQVAPGVKPGVKAAAAPTPVRKKQAAKSATTPRKSTPRKQAGVKHESYARVRSAILNGPEVVPSYKALKGLCAPVGESQIRKVLADLAGQGLVYKDGQKWKRRK